MTVNAKCVRRLLSVGALAGAVVLGVEGAEAQYCSSYLGLYQQGATDAQVARLTGLSVYEARFCRRVLSEPIYIGPAGAPPVNAAGRPPGPNAAGPPPGPGMLGPPPGGAAGPPPVGRDVRRIP
ncbi:hypothetical protein L6Q96_12350 [Candidatus Binatia bacterium]|nr:hypothetical protein [Candidatus Binatia bacterium]